MPAVDNTTASTTGNVALTTTEAALIGTTGFPLLNTGSGRATPAALVIAFVPNVTGVAAAATVTVNLRAGTTSAGAVFGAGVATNSGAGAAAVGPIVAVGLAPAGTENVFVGAVMSSGTGTAAASATVPIVAVALTLD